MDPSKATVRELFAHPVHYIVPAFQRSYVWNEEIQWEPLWQDVIDTTQDFMEQWRENDDQLKAMAEVNLHFMGAIVMKQQLTAPGQPSNRIIVDGQQRLTTLQILMVAIANSLEEMSKETDEQTSIALSNDIDTIRALIENPDRNRNLGEFKYKIRPFNSDFEVFTELIDGGNYNDTSHIMVKCYCYFKNCVIKWLKDDIKNIEQRAEGLITTIFDLFMIFTLNLDFHEDEYLIFETLNARAESLTEWDKAKNHFLSKSSETELGENQFYDEFIDEFDAEEWWKQDAQQPRFEGNRVGLLLNHWLEIHLSENVPARRGYYKFRKYVRDKGDVLSVARSFKNYAQIFREIEMQPEDDSIQGIFRYRRGVLRAGVVVPLMMKLRDLLGTGVDMDRCTRAIECYLVRRTIMGSTTRGYDALFMSLLQKVNRMDGSDEIVSIIIDSLANSGYDWPSDQSILEAVLTRRMYPGVAQERLRMILEAVESYMLSGMAAYSEVPSNLWIEHIMPQGWRTHWELTNDSEESAEDERDRSVATLGNLTLLNSKLDISISNKSWNHKLDAIRKSDNLFMNKRICDESPEVWDESKIEERGKWMAEVICEIWPHGDALKQKFKIK